ncbi:N-acetyltransferase [Saccharopolyspora rhizosphaerae]|uniref:N-acetyltransferase n=1 Tax=Saccharopolyspora rhizosphaerae TaxID=2492662 RepID=A0A3R8QL46_9PSEU|nr:N-acetyltransferase [Saccharopolyspora rhizosphaerae]RRO14870.1 N-acetyltransferase [Saccharopolyspora rhizosphaerae]
MLIRRETPADLPPIRQVHAAAFADAENPQSRPVEVGLVDALRDGDAWLPALSLVAERSGEVVGHVVCTRAHVGDVPVLALGPVGVPPDLQRAGIGSALMHAVLGAADALDEPLVALLGHREYYPRFGFEPAADRGITPPVPEWASHFQVRPLSGYDPAVRGEFAYAAPFMEL